MQIDFHHGTTYVVARYAGFNHTEAEIIAYCSQYVDDATNSGVLRFDNGAMYRYISSAHKTLDYRNFNELSNSQVWIPFHFLPGNAQKPAGESPVGGFIEKLICCPDSPVAHEMVRECILDNKKPYSLHRLGITLHVYADTWAHQGFAGVTHKVNDVHALDEYGNVDKTFLEKKKHFFEDLVNEVTGKFIGDVKPLGHGAALSQPDKPFLKWSYHDHNNQWVKRDNSKIFLQAANSMCQVMRRYQLRDPDAQVSGLSQEAQDKIEELFLSFTDEDGEMRHRQWLEKIEAGFFGFTTEKLEYHEKGVDSWTYQALKTDEPIDIFRYSNLFLKSDWKMFHDALQAHRFFIIHDLLPNYGICVA